MNFLNIKYNEEIKSLLVPYKHFVVYSAEDCQVKDIHHSLDELDIYFGKYISILCPKELPQDLIIENLYVDVYYEVLIYGINRYKSSCDSKCLRLRKKALDHIHDIENMSNLGLDNEKDERDILLLKQYIKQLRDVKLSPNYPLNIEWPNYPLEVECQ